MRLSPYTMLLLLALLLPATFAPAQETPKPATTQPAEAKPVDPVEQKILDALPLLGKRATGEPAVNSLVELRDPRVLRFFKHVDAARVYNHEGKPVVVYNDGKDKPLRVYDLFVELDEQDQPVGEPAQTLAFGTIKENTVLDVAKPVQRLIGNSLLGLGLKVNDARERRLAARAIGNKRVIAALPELRKLIDSEPDAAVKREAEESVAMIVAVGLDTSASPEARLAAIKTLGEMNSIRGRSVLIEIRDTKTPDAPTSAALTTSIKQIEWHMTVTDWIKNVFYGLSAGSIFVLLALGLAITFGLMGVINMAHGEMLMIGAVTTWACHELFLGRLWLGIVVPYVGELGFTFPGMPLSMFDWYYVLALPVSFLVAAMVGLLIELLIVKHLYKRPLDSLLATIGVSYVLIQGVRLWKGDNLGMRGPSWSGGSIEIMQDVSLAYNRLFLIALSVFCVLLVVGIFRYTRLGLMIRATVQNREMAQACGVNTRLVDMFTFAFGAGLAGLAGYGIVLTANPTPDMGQGYIVKTFLTVVVGGVGKLAGVICSGLGIGFAEKLLEPIVLLEKPIHLFDATWAQVATLVLVILFMQRRPGGLFPDKGRMADQADKTAATTGLKMGLATDLVLGLTLMFVGLGLVPLLYFFGFMTPEFVNKLGYIFAFAICAIGLDLVWGYIGVLSLCQFLFFTLGGYCMGLYLVNYGPKNANGVPDALARVMSSQNEPAPWFLGFFESFPTAIALGLVLPGLVALIIGLTTFRSRVRGVYFSILTQAITVAFWLVFQKNELKLGGTNGLTDFITIAGKRIANNPDLGPIWQTRFWLYIASCVMLLVSVLFTRLLVRSGFGRVLLAIRDDETRLRFVGYQTWAYKAAAFTIAAMLGAIGGMLYVPQKGILTPSEMTAGASILVVAWVAIGGRGTIWGAVLGAISISLLYDSLTSGVPPTFITYPITTACHWIGLESFGRTIVGAIESLWKPKYWLFVLGGLFVVIPLLFPGGLISIPTVVGRQLMRFRRTAPGFEVGKASPAIGGH